MPELVENDTLFALRLGLFPEILYISFVYNDAGGHFGFWYQSDTEPYDRYFIGFVLPELVANDTLLVFLSQLLPEIPDILYCQMIGGHFENRALVKLIFTCQEFIETSFPHKWLKLANPLRRRYGQIDHAF